MTNNRDLRKLSRLLCDENFSDCEVLIGSKTFTMVAVNFHHQGIGLHASEFVEEFDRAHLSFNYCDIGHNIEFTLLPVKLCYRFDTEVGSQFGFSFDIDPLHKLSTLMQLQEIELNVKAYEESDRYGINSLFD